MTISEGSGAVGTIVYPARVQCKSCGGRGSVFGCNYVPDMYYQDGVRYCSTPIHEPTRCKMCNGVGYIFIDAN